MQIVVPLFYQGKATANVEDAASFSVQNAAEIEKWTSAGTAKIASFN